MEDNIKLRLDHDLRILVMKVFNGKYIRWRYYRVILEEHMTPLILDEEEDGDDADDHRAGNADDDHQPAVHLGSYLYY